MYQEANIYETFMLAKSLEGIVKYNHFLSHVPKGVKISEAQNLLSEFHIRLDNTQIAYRIECEIVLKYCTTEIDDIACCDKRCALNLFSLLFGDLFKP